MLLITEDLIVLDRKTPSLEDDRRFVLIKDDINENLVDDNGKATPKAIEIAKNAMAIEAKRVGGDDVEIISASKCVNVTNQEVVEEIQDDSIIYLDAGTLVSDHDFNIFLTEAGFGVDLEQVQGEAYIEFMGTLDDNGTPTGKSYQEIKKDKLINALKNVTISNDECREVVERGVTSLLLTPYKEEVLSKICG